MYKVLIIDDDKLARKGLISIVPWERCGLEVAGDVPNGKCALEFLREHPVDLAIVDMSMPVMSGLEFIEAGQAEFPRLQYVVLSFYESFEYVQSALRLGALDYISKLRLEEEDCAAAFSRIGNLLAMRLQQPDPETAGPAGISTEHLQTLREEWCTLYWMYDSARFEQMAEELRALPLTLTQMEKLVFWTAQALEDSFQEAFPVPSYRTGEESLHWLALSKRQLEEVCGEKADFTLLPFCILASALYINRHLTEPLRSGDVAAAVRLSRSYFSTNFKKLTGCAFHDYVRDKRIALAKQLLAERDYSAAELAALVGYEDSKYFSRVFHEQEGVSCSQFRKQICIG
ncbi:helix-turn-helix domain-containing protein [Ruminococcaceae bacterium OttesenSCG-928-L11]|nr:helix-turn-helix domain-containing protein [Ruminococcaceae bacterium OttesenSCG-928-L11]